MFSIQPYHHFSPTSPVKTLHAVRLLFGQQGNDTARQTEPVVPRMIGDYSQGVPGPTIILVGGMHGNEPEGITALQRVFKILEKQQIPVRGRIIGISGNRKALAAGKRFIDRDLNRHWTHQDIDRLMAEGPPFKTSEDAEIYEMMQVIQPLLNTTDRMLVFIDLHTTSAHAGLFSVPADTLRNRKLSMKIPIPVVLGLEEAMAGIMASYFHDLGHIAMAIEGGQQNRPETVQNLENVIWIALQKTGTLKKNEIPNYQTKVTHLTSQTRSKPGASEIRYRHHVNPTDQFQMNPGYTNFQPIRKGEVLALSSTGEILSHESGRILMPLYQAQGDDGFFITRDISKGWLHLSGLLRRLRMDRLIPLLPGVKKHPTHPDQYLVDTKIARYLTTEIFHLFGYWRSEPAQDGRLVFSRRNQGFRSKER